MKIVAVCGMGIGTSVLLKMNAEKALTDLGMDADVEAADIGVARGAAQTADIVLTSEELAPEIGEVPAQVIVIENFFDLDEINAEHGDKITFLKMNVDENPVTPSSYRVTGIPTINVYQGGEVVKSIVGARPKAALLNELESVL